MGHPSHQPPKPPISGSDLAISIATLTITVLLGVVAAVFGLFSLAFLDHCPPETCSAEGAVGAVVNALLIAFAVGVVGLVATVVQIVRRKRGWPFAVATLVLCALAVFLGGVGYAMAVGA
jgi:uncharacterized membrane protein